MDMSSVMRSLCTVAMVSGVALFALSGATPAADVQTNASQVQTNVFQNGQAGFVVSHIPPSDRWFGSNDLKYDRCKNNNANQALVKALMRKQGKRRRLSPCHWISVVAGEQG